MKALFSAIALAFFAIMAAGTATMAHTNIVAQATPEPMETPAATPQMSPMPASTAAPTTIDVKQGGTTTNSNGANWLDKFNRNPGPDTSNVIHGARAPVNTTKPMTKRTKPHPMPTTKP